VDNTAQLPEMSCKHRYGELKGIVPEELDALDTGLLHRMGKRRLLVYTLYRVQRKTVVLISDPPVYHPVPVVKTAQKSKVHYEQERRECPQNLRLTSRTSNIVKERDGTNPVLNYRAEYDRQNDGRGHHYARSQSVHIPGTAPPLLRFSKLTKVPNIPGVYDQTLRSYSDFLVDDDNNDPWVEKMRGIGPLSSSVSLFCSPFKSRADQ